MIFPHYKGKFFNVTISEIRMFLQLMPKETQSSQEWVLTGTYFNSMQGVNLALWGKSKFYFHVN